ncbi:MAG: ABC transporter ATP-binding protein [Acidimicrobiales bacterium]|nr:ABC transporter ATP-binding protein [Acidimicrobiales bacterium]
MTTAADPTLVVVEGGGSSAPMPPGALLEVRNVTVRFGGLVANDEINLSVPTGGVAGLIGPNGAGKTTLFNVITGAQPPTSGSVIFDGHDITADSRQKRARRGMARTFQNLSLVLSLSVLDNVTLGCGRFRRSGLMGSIVRTPGLRRQDRLVRDVALGALDFVGLLPEASRSTADLTYGDRRRLEIARALALEPRLLLLDEPSAGMGPRETAQLANVIDRARTELGLSVLLVEHDMSFVRALAESCTVLEFGRVLATGPTRAVLDDPAVAEAYLGKTGTS